MEDLIHPFSFVWLLDFVESYKSLNFNSSHSNIAYRLNQDFPPLWTRMD